MSRNYHRKRNGWYIRKYKGDGALYAICACGYKVPCYKQNGHFKVTIGYTYPYCPMCGKRKSFWITRDDIYERYYDGNN